MRFEWDEEKARRSLRKHGVSFHEAALAFDDPHAITGYDAEHSQHEPRQWLLGMSPKRRVLLVVFTERFNDVVRLISAWKATPEECDLYESEKQE